MAGACRCGTACAWWSPPWSPTPRASPSAWRRATAQLGSGVFSKVGQYFRLRRSDLRIFVGAGAAAAIAAAFNAPLAGAFYGYELILGSYAVRPLAPVAAAALAATLTLRALMDPGAAVRRRRHLPLQPVALPAVRAARHPGRRLQRAGHAGGDLVGARAAPPAVAAMAAAGGRRPAGERHRAPGAAGPGQRPRRHPARVRRRLHPAPAAAPAGGQAARLGDLAGRGLPRRHVQLVAAPGLPVRRGVRRRRDLLPAPPGRAACDPDDGRHGLGGGGGDRRAAHHGVPGAGRHRQLPGDRGRAGRRGVRLDDRAPHLRLFLLDLALPSARHRHPQPARYRLAGRPHGGPADARRSQGRAGDHAACRAAREISAGQRQARVRRVRRRRLHRHARHRGPPRHRAGGSARPPHRRRFRHRPRSLPAALRERAHRAAALRGKGGRDAAGAGLRQRPRRWWAISPSNMRSGATTRSSSAAAPPISENATCSRSPSRRARLLLQELTPPFADDDGRSPARRPCRWRRRGRSASGPAGSCRSPPGSSRSGS